MKIKEFIKENYKFIILMILIVLFFNVKLPYYIMAPGGTINITDRVVMDNYNKKSKGSLIHERSRNFKRSQDFNRS